MCSPNWAIKAEMERIEKKAGIKTDKDGLFYVVLSFEVMLSFNTLFRALSAYRKVIDNILLSDDERDKYYSIEECELSFIPLEDETDVFVIAHSEKDGTIKMYRYPWNATGDNKYYLPVYIQKNLNGYYQEKFRLKVEEK